MVTVILSACENDFTHGKINRGNNKIRALVFWVMRKFWLVISVKNTKITGYLAALF